RHDLQSADRGVVARGSGQLGGDRFTGELLFPDRIGRQLLQSRLLLGRGGRVDTRVIGDAELRLQLSVVFAWILVRAGGDFGRQQVHDRAVLVGRPHGAV